MLSEMTAAAQNSLQARMLNSSRLRIPIDFTAETLHSGGHAGCTVFPMPCLQGSPWNVTLVQAIGAANALQAESLATAARPALVAVVPLAETVARTSAML